MKIDIDYHKILVDLYGPDQPIPKFAKDIGKTRQSVYRWLSGKVRMPRLVRKYIIMKVREKNQQDKIGCAGRP